MLYSTETAMMTVVNVLLTATDKSWDSWRGPVIQLLGGMLLSLNIRVAFNTIIIFSSALEKYLDWMMLFLNGYILIYLTANSSSLLMDGHPQL